MEGSEARRKNRARSHLHPHNIASERASPETRKHGPARVQTPKSRHAQHFRSEVCTQKTEARTAIASKTKDDTPIGIEVATEGRPRPRVLINAERGACMGIFFQKQMKGTGCTASRFGPGKTTKREWDDKRKNKKRRVGRMKERKGNEGEDE